MRLNTIFYQQKYRNNYAIYKFNFDKEIFISICTSFSILCFSKAGKGKPATAKSAAPSAQPTTDEESPGEAGGITDTDGGTSVAPTTTTEGGQTAEYEGESPDEGVQSAVSSVRTGKRKSFQFKNFQLHTLGYIKIHIYKNFYESCRNYIQFFFKFESPNFVSNIPAYQLIAEKFSILNFKYDYDYMIL